jgi:hypothetical protein
METAKPCAKGKGVLLMVANFVSADYGFLHSLDLQGLMSWLKQLLLLIP